MTVGRVGKPHGLDGGFFVEGASERKERLRRGRDALRGRRAGDRRRLAPRLRRPAGDPARPATWSAAPSSPSRARRCPSLADEDEFYVFQLVGLSVEEEGGRLLGRVREVLEYPGNDVLELDSGASLPLVEACVRQVDLAGGRIVVAAGFADPE